MFYFNINGKSFNGTTRFISIDIMAKLTICFAIILNGLVFSSFISAAIYETGLVRKVSLVNGNYPDFRLPREPIQLLFEADPSAIEASGYFFELDDIDITDVVQFDAGIAAYLPIQPLSNGEHQIKVIKYLESGEPVVVGSWEITVHQSRLFEEYSVSANTQIISSYRFAEQNIGTPPPRSSQTQGSSQIAFKATNGNWTTQGQFDLYYTSVKANRPTSRTIENGEFVVSVGNESINAVVGHQAIGQSSLVMSNFRRRGVSVSGNLPLGGAQMTGFALSSANISGFGQGLGVSRANERVTGFQFNVNPLEEAPQALTITGTWLNGNGDDNFRFVSQFDNLGEVESAPSKGSAWSLKGSGFYLENKLQLEFEYAETEFDDNPIDAIEKDNDSAYSLATIYSDTTEEGLAWNIGFNQQKIGTYFRSIANRNIASDRKISNINTSLQWSTLGIQAALGQQQDNIEKLEQLPQIETNLGRFMLNWSPALETQDHWFGTPSFTAGYNQQSQQQTFSPADYAFAATDNSVSSWQASGNFGFTEKSYSISFSQTDFVDDSNVQDDSVTTGIDFSGNWLVNDVINISSSVRFNSTKNTISGLVSDGVTYSLQSSFTLEEQAINGSIGYLVNKNQTNDLSTNGLNTSAEFTLNWRPYLPSANSLGVDISLSASYNDFEDKLFAFNSLETLQSFLTVTLLLPSYQGSEE